MPALEWNLTLLYNKNQLGRLFVSWSIQLEQCYHLSSSQLLSSLQESNLVMWKSISKEEFKTALKSCLFSVSYDFQCPPPLPFLDYHLNILMPTCGTNSACLVQFALNIIDSHTYIHICLPYALIAYAQFYIHLLISIHKYLLYLMYSSI